MRRIAYKVKRWTTVLVTSFVVLTASALARAETPTGAAYVTTLPSGADIWIDGTYVGRAPVLVDALLAGPHNLTITKTGWAVKEVEVAVGAGTVAFSDTRLVAGPRAMAGNASGYAIVRNAPPGATLALDGAPLDHPIGQRFGLAAGPHRLTLTTASGKTSRSFNVLPATCTDVVLATPLHGAVRSAVVAPVDDYLPDGSVVVEGKKIVVRYEGHVAVAHFGMAMVRLDGVTFPVDAAPESIAGRLYLPLELLEKLTDDTSKSP